MNLGTLEDILADVALKHGLLGGVHDFQNDAACTLNRSPLQQPHRGRHRYRASALLRLPLAFMHVASFSADKRRINFYVSADLHY